MKAKSSKAKPLTSKAMKKTKGGAPAAIAQGKLQTALPAAAMDQSFTGSQDTLEALRARKR